MRPSLITAQGAEARLPQAHRDYNASRVHSSIGGGVPPDEFPWLWERNNKQGGADDDGGDRGQDPPKICPKIVLNPGGPDHNASRPKRRPWRRASR